MSYATVDELEDHLDGDPTPAHPERLLDRASERVDEMLIGAVYDGTDPDVTAALKRATLLQAQWMAPDETGQRAQFSSMSTGGVSWTRAQRQGGGVTDSRFSPDALSYIRTSGLLAGLSVTSY